MKKETFIPFLCISFNFMINDIKCSSKDHEQPEWAEECRTVVKLQDHVRDLQECLQQKRSRPGRPSRNVNFVSFSLSWKSDFQYHTFYTWTSTKTTNPKASKEASAYFDYDYLQDHSDNLNYDVYLLCNKNVFCTPSWSFLLSTAWNFRGSLYCITGQREGFVSKRNSYLSEVHLNLLEPHIFVGCSCKQMKIFQNI